MNVARFLVEHGANINAKDYHGRTPLSLAYIRGNRRFLLTNTNNFFQLGIFTIQVIWMSLSFSLKTEPI